MPIFPGPSPKSLYHLPEALRFDDSLRVVYRTEEYNLYNSSRSCRRVLQDRTETAKVRSRDQAGRRRSYFLPFTKLRRSPLPSTDCDSAGPRSDGGMHEIDLQWYKVFTNPSILLSKHNNGLLRFPCT